MERWKLVIRGKVQGVWYRANCRDKAIELGLSGFVKNLPDGSVYVEAQGEDSALEALIHWCKIGSPLASVKEVVQDLIPTLNNEASFEIRR